MFPLFWWALTSIKPMSAIFNKDKVVFFDFVPTLDQLRASTLLGKSRSELAIESGIDLRRRRRQFLRFAPDHRRFDHHRRSARPRSPCCIGVLAAYALSRMTFRGRKAYLNWVLAQRFMPPIAIIVPLVFMFQYRRPARHRQSLMGYVGLILIYALMNLPIAVLLMKSFFDDVPKDVDEAAMIDGATRLQTFRRIVLPMVQGGIAATAVLCFIFSWTEFLLSLFLTTSIRTLPVKITTFVTSTGSEWGFISALGTSAIVPSFIFILLVQSHLVRGLTLGSLKE